MRDNELIEIILKVFIITIMEIETFHKLKSRSSSAKHFMQISDYKKTFFNQQK